MITAMNHITLAVKDLEKSFKFYRDVLGLKPLVKWEKGAYFLVGSGSAEFWFCLNSDSNREPNLCCTHYAFSVDQIHFEALAKKIINAEAKVYKENMSPGDSLYFQDPDGHKLEIHIGNWQSRVEAKKLNLGSWQEVEWFV